MSFPTAPVEGYSDAPEAPQQPRQESQRSPKMRLSCDECAVAKVRCNKTQPICERCISNGLKCVYGVSMKHGRGAGKRRKAAAAHAAQSQSGSSHDAQKASAVTHEDWQSLNACIFSGQAPVAPMLGTISPSASSSVRKYLSSSVARTPTSDGTVSTDFADDIFSFSCNTPFDLPELAPGVLEQVSTDLHYNFSPHDCYELAHSTMALLFFNPNSPSIESMEIDGEKCNRQKSALNLEDVLQGIKGALANVSELVRCWCLNDSPMNLLCASIIMRLLYWHRVVMGNASSYISRSPPCSSLDSTLTSVYTRLGQPVSITAEPFTIGNFVPDAEEQDMIRRTYLLGNLRKIENMIETFSNVGELHRTLATSLRSELARAMDEVNHYGVQSAV